MAACHQSLVAHLSYFDICPAQLLPSCPYDFIHFSVLLTRPGKAALFLKKKQVKPENNDMRCCMYVQR